VKEKLCYFENKTFNEIDKFEKINQFKWAVFEYFGPHQKLKREFN
jgi:hypothetical protein